MIFFIPAWYEKDSYQEKEQEWYIRKMQSDVDESVKHIQLFQNNGAFDYCLLLQGYCPNLRHFLHRQGIYTSLYWSCFDAMMQIESTAVVPISYRMLDWPKDVSFVYSATSVLAMRQKDLYARVVFGDDGNMIRVEMFENGTITQTNIYDDRGFLSSMVVYDNGQPLYQEYLMENGDWKLRHLLADDVVLINPDCMQYTIRRDANTQVYAFQKQAYESMESLLTEVTESYIRTSAPEDVFVAACDRRHEHLITTVLADRKVLFTASETKDAQVELGIELMASNPEHTRLITPSEEMADEIRKEMPQAKESVIAIDPYYLVPANGISMQMQELKILVAADALDETLFQRLMLLLGHYLENHKRAWLYVLTRRGQLSATAQLERRIKILWRANEIDESRLRVVQCVDDADCERLMREQRLLIDLGGKNRSVYLQHLALAYGVPMIVDEESAYCVSERNGKVINKLEHLPAALTYYLESLEHWNQVVVEARDIGSAFEADNLINRWREVMEDIG